MSCDLNKICVTFSSPILDMIIVRFIYLDNSLFAGLVLAVLRLYSQCQNIYFLQCLDEKIPISSRKKFRRKIIVLLSKLCLKLFVYIFTDCWHLCHATTM